MINIMENIIYYCFFCDNAIHKTNTDYKTRSYDYCQQYQCNNHFCRECQKMYLMNSKRILIYYCEENDALCFACLKKLDLLYEKQNQ